MSRGPIIPLAGFPASLRSIARRRKRRYANTSACAFSAYESEPMGFGMSESLASIHAREASLPAKRFSAPASENHAIAQARKSRFQPSGPKNGTFFDLCARHARRGRPGAGETQTASRRRGRKRPHNPDSRPHRARPWRVFRLVCPSRAKGKAVSWGNADGGPARRDGQRLASPAHLRLESIVSCKTILEPKGDTPQLAQMAPSGPIGEYPLLA